MPEPLQPEPPTAEAPPPAPAPRRWWRRWKLWVALLLVTPILLFVLYPGSALSWSYSEGSRAGYLQKFSKKGWVCKTWEGELALVTMPGTVGEKFYFSVRSAATAEQINRSI